MSHQRALEDASATIYSELEVLIAKLSNELQNSELFVSKPRLKLLACTEICQAYLLYGRVQKAEEYLTKGRELAGLKLELTGMHIYYINCWLNTFILHNYLPKVLS